MARECSPGPSASEMIRKGKPRRERLKARTKPVGPAPTIKAEACAPVLIGSISGTIKVHDLIEPSVRSYSLLARKRLCRMTNDQWRNRGGAPELCSGGMTASVNPGPEPGWYQVFPAHVR